MANLTPQSKLLPKTKYADFRMIVILCLAVSVGRFSLDSYLPSLPAIALAFHATADQVQLTLTFYFLGYGISQFLYGPLSEKFGRRHLLLLGMSIFLLGSFLCAVSVSINMLIAARLLAGIGAGAGGVLARAIVSDWFPDYAMATVWAQVTTAIVVSLTIGPVLGGAIQQYFSFEYNFWLSFLYGVVVFIILIYYLPETHHQTHAVNLNIKKITATYFNILMNRRFIIYTVCSTIAFSALTIFFQLSPFIFISDFGYTPIKYGFVLIWIAFGYIIGGRLVKIYSTSYSSNTVVNLGALLILAAVALLVLWHFFALAYESIAVTVVSILFVIGSRLIVATGMAAGLKSYRHIAGYAAALSGGVQMLGGTLISYCIAQVFVGTPLHRLTLALFGIGIFILLLISAIGREKNYREKI